MRIKAKIKTTDIVIAWVEVDETGKIETVEETLDYVEGVEAEIIEQMD